MLTSSRDSLTRMVRERGEDIAMAARLTRDLPRAWRNPLGPEDTQERLADG